MFCFVFKALPVMKDVEHGEGVNPKMLTWNWCARCHLGAGWRCLVSLVPSALETPPHTHTHIQVVSRGGGHTWAALRMMVFAASCWGLL